MYFMINIVLRWSYVDRNLVAMSIKQKLLVSLLSLQKMGPFISTKLD